MSLIANSLDPNSFYKVNKVIMHHFGSVDVAMLLAELISRQRYFASRGSLDEEGGFFCNVKSLEEELLLTKQRRVEATKTLEMAGCIRVALKGQPRRNFYYIQDQNIAQILSCDVPRMIEYDEINEDPPGGIPTDQKCLPGGIPDGAPGGIPTDVYITNKNKFNKMKDHGEYRSENQPIEKGLHPAQIQNLIFENSEDLRKLETMLKGMYGGILPRGMKSNLVKIYLAGNKNLEVIAKALEDLWQNEKIREGKDLEGSRGSYLTAALKELFDL